MKLRPVISYWKMGSAESGGRRRERTWDGEIKKKSVKVQLEMT